MKYVIMITIALGIGALRAESVQKVSVDLSAQELRALVRVLDEIVQTRAPRIDLPNYDSPEYPVATGDSADFEFIKSALCSLRLLLLSSSAAIGSLDTPGSCFPAITTIADIDDATLNVIAWLKTLMRELRGVCVP